jgi:hypothetical protein
MHHIQFCLEEILAEIDAALEENGFVRALAQLDQREAEHDPVTAIDGAELRDHINRRIDSLPLKQARNRIIQAQGLVEVAFGLKKPMPARSNVIVLAAEGGVSNRDAAANAAIPKPAAPMARPAPQFKTMQERLAAAVGGGNQRRLQSRRA